MEQEYIIMDPIPTEPPEVNATLAPPNVTVIGNTTYCWSEKLQGYSWCQTEQLFSVPTSKTIQIRGQISPDGGICLDV